VAETTLVVAYSSSDGSIFLTETEPFEKCLMEQLLFLMNIWKMSNVQYVSSYMTRCTYEFNIFLQFII